MEVTKFTSLYNQPKYGYVPIGKFNRGEYTPHIPLPKDVTINMSVTAVRRLILKMLKYMYFDHDKHDVFMEDIHALHKWAELQRNLYGDQHYINAEIDKFDKFYNGINKDIDNIDSIKNIVHVDTGLTGYITNTITDNITRSEIAGKNYTQFDNRYWERRITIANLEYMRDLTKNLMSFLDSYPRAHELEYININISNNNRLLDGALIHMLSETTLIDVTLNAGKKPNSNVVLKSLLKAMMLKTGRYALGRDVINREHGDNIEHPLYFPDLKHVRIVAPRYADVYDIDLDDIKPVTDYITSYLFNLDASVVTSKMLKELEEEIKVFYEVDKKGNLI